MENIVVTLFFIVQTSTTCFWKACVKVKKIVFTELLRPAGVIIKNLAPAPGVLKKVGACGSGSCSKALADIRYI